MGLTKQTQVFVQKMIDASFNVGWIDITSLGCNGSNDCGKILTDYINSKQVDSVINLYVPPGVFYLKSTLLIVDRKVNIRGYDRGLSIFYVVQGIDGIKVDRKKGLRYDWTFERFAINALGKVGTNHGIMIWQRGILRDLDIQGFSGTGVYIDGYAVGSADKDAAHNAAFSKVYDCLIAGNDGHGILIDGQDGNACITFGNDIRNNGGWGIWDSSLLGGSHFGNMMHSNKLGAYTVDGDVNQTSIFGGYIENDHGPNQFPNKLVKVYGGYSQAGNVGGDVK